MSNAHGCSYLIIGLLDVIIIMTHRTPVTSRVPWQATNNYYQNEPLI